MLRFIVLLILSAAYLAEAAVNVTTQHNDNLRTGANLAETILMPGNVRTGQFGKLFEQSIDGYAYAQPLCVSAVSIPGKGTHNVIYVATEHDSVYAFDADDASGANAQPLWKTSFLDAANGITTVPAGENGAPNDVNSTDIVPEIGITSTPVIDLVSSTIYVLAKTKHTNDSTYAQHLHALDIRTGQEKPGSPVLIQASVFGSGDGGDGSGKIVFDPLIEHNRPGLLLLNGAVYIAWASHGDNGQYHGWVLGYNKTTLRQVAVFNVTPDGRLGGIWMSGAGLAADSKNNLFISTGNGSFDIDANGVHVGNNFGDSVVKLAAGPAGNLTPVDYFTPYNQVDLYNGDNDFGSGGVMLLPDQAGPHPHLAITCGKEGKVYLLDRDHLGGFTAGRDAVVQSFSKLGGGAWSTPAYFGGRVYYHAADDVLRAYSMVNGLFALPAGAQGLNQLGFPGSTPSISANGTTNGIVWEVAFDTPAVLYAYNAADVSTELYDSNQASNNRDTLPAGVKFTVPTIANGKVYVGTQTTLSVFGLFHNVSTLTVSTKGNGSVTTAFAGSTPRQVNTALSVTATPAAGNVLAGWKDLGSGVIISHVHTLNFTMQEGLSLEADFVPDPFTAVAGSYTGLALVQGPAIQNGCPATITVNTDGSFTASVKLGVNTFALHGSFLTDGSFTTTIARPGAALVSVSLQLDVSSGSGEVTGIISDGFSTGTITTDRTKNATQPANYTVVIPHPSDTSQPQGDGYGTVKVDAAGNIRFAGVLGDGTPVAQGALLSRAGSWVFYVAPYGANGSATGLLKFEDTGTSDIDGTLRWFKPPTATAAIDARVPLLGSAFQTPPAGTPILSLSSPSFKVQGGNLNPPPPAKPFSIGADNKITLGSGVTGLTMTFDVKTGLFSGTFTDLSNQIRSYSGAVFQKTNFGDGLFKGNGGAYGSVSFGN